MPLSQIIISAINKFRLKLNGCRVLTEAATGNYVVTPVIAAAAGADVTAFARSSEYGSISEVLKQTKKLSDTINLSGSLEIITELSNVNLLSFNIVTNCGFIRPLTRDFVSRLSPECVIPLMYEPWEFRDGEIDLNACHEKGIKVYGTNESDPRLQTTLYIGYTALYLLLAAKQSPFSVRVLILGCERFAQPIASVLKRNGYNVRSITNYLEKVSINKYNAIIVAEHSDDRLLIGADSSAFIKFSDISCGTYVIHIAGNVNFHGAPFAYTPETPRPFGFMSYTTDYIDPKAVVDLHAAGLKVGEGMLKANRLGLEGRRYKHFMEENYPSISFNDEYLW